MVNIDVPGLAKVFEKYRREHPIDDYSWNKEVMSKLIFPVERSLTIQGRKVDYIDYKGLRFSNSNLFFQVLERAYDQIASEKESFSLYASRMANALQSFANGFLDKENNCQPHFLVHGLEEPSVNGVEAKFLDNSRIILESLRYRDLFKERNSKIPLDNDLSVKLELEHGEADSFFGLSANLYSRATEDIGEYFAKVGFFLDVTNNEIVVMNFQGQNRLDYNKADVLRMPMVDKEKGRQYARLKLKLGSDPRTFVLKQIMNIARIDGYEKIKVVRPDFHPYSIESHIGFLGRYEPQIIEAGVDEVNGCYLEKRLNYCQEKVEGK